MFLGSLFSAIFSVFLCILLVILLFNMAPKGNVEVPSSVSKHKKAVMCLMEKICALGKHHVGRSYGAVGCELSVNKPTPYIQ